MTRWDDSFLRIPAAELVEAQTARDALGPDAAPQAIADADAALADAQDLWADASQAWQLAADSGWLDPAPEAEAG